MIAAHPTDPVIACVGEGCGPLLMHFTAPRLSLENREITILATNDDAVATDQQYAHNVGEKLLRSEFESRSLAPDWPTVAQLDAYSHKSPKPLWRTRSEPVGRRPGSDRPDAVLRLTPGAARIG